MIALRYATVPKVSAMLTIQSGLAVDPADKAGLAQFVVDLAQEGTTTRSSEQIKREVFAMGASLTGFAGQDASTFQIRGLNDTLPQMLALLADVVRNPTFPQGELDLMKANTAQQLQAQTASPQFVNNKLFRQTLFGAHPYARIGVTPETLPAIDRAVDRRRIQQTYYRPNNAFLIVVGDVAADAVFAAAEKAFGGWERRALPGDQDGAAAGAEGPHAGVRAAAQQRAVVDLGRQLHARSATIRAGTRCSWPTRSSAPRSTRGWCATSAKRRATPTRRSRSSRRWGRAACIARSPTCATTSPARR